MADEKRPPMWGIHAGQKGDADSLFLDKNFVGIGWREMGDLSAGNTSQDGLKKRVEATYPDYRPGKVPVVAGMLRRFLNEIKVGDHVLYPRKSDRTLWLGKVKGDYEYRPDLMEEYPNVRPVEWIGSRPRTDFLQSALYEVGSALSLFQVAVHGDHILNVFEGTESTIPGPEAGEETYSSELVESVEDYVIRRLQTLLHGAPLERFVSDLLEAMGYHCRLTKVSGDGGVDIEAARGPLGFEPPIIRVQVKSTTATISDSDVKHLFASINGGEYGLFVTLGGYSKPATEFARTKPNLSLVTGSAFVALVLEHYDRLSPGSKAIVPLKRSFVPDE